MSDKSDIKKLVDIGQRKMEGIPVYGKDGLPTGDIRPAAPWQKEVKKPRRSFWTIVSLAIRRSRIRLAAFILPEDLSINVSSPGSHERVSAHALERVIEGAGGKERQARLAGLTADQQRLATLKSPAREEARIASWREHLDRPAQGPVARVATNELPSDQTSSVFKVDVGDVHQAEADAKMDEVKARYQQLAGIKDGEPSKSAGPSLPQFPTALGRADVIVPDKKALVEAIAETLNDPDRPRYPVIKD